MKRPRHETSPSMSRRLCYRGGETSGHINIPLDLMVEILKKLPAKSLLRFRCVSKQWSSIISCRRDFIDSIVTRSLTQPQPHDTHLICHNYSDNRFLSSSTYITGKESVSIPGRVHQYVRGLVYCWSLSSPVAVIYNPTTRQSLDLPEIQHLSLVNCFFGYDPLENQYKLLFVPSMDKSCHVFTLGDNQWRNIQCSVGPHHPRLSPVCIKGIIYYRASKKYNDSTIFLVSFDVRSEKFGRVQAPKTQMDSKTDLINYQGKLGLMRREKSMEIWVLEVAKKTQEWCKIFSYEMEGFGHWRMSGVTSGGEIHFRSFFHSNEEQLDVFYYDPKRNCMRYGDMEGTYPMEKRSKSSVVMLVVPDPVENTMSLTEEKKKQ